jgi:hydroxymethylpyrimidine/phosphomethylpyrimidine kinase
MTRTEGPVSPPVVCTIATSDSGGGAGIQADLKTIEAGGGFGTSVVVATTAQNTQGVHSIHTLPTAETEAQLAAVTDDFDVAAAKTGMLATAEVVRTVTDHAREFPFPLVVDPVMVAATGDRLLEPEGEDAYEDLVAEATLVTPNADEAAVLAGVEVTDEESARRAGETLVEMGAEAALVKGGHVPGEDVVDVLVSADAVETVRHPRVETDATHGSGCTLSSAVATRLAHGDPLSAAVREGVDLLGRAVRYNLDVGAGPGAVHHTVSLRDRAERQPTAERVAEVAHQFVRLDASPLVPDAGSQVVGATPYAESPAECAAVDGRLVGTLDGVRGGDARFGVSDRLVGLLLAAREADPDLRFAASYRHDDAILAGLEAPVVELDPGTTAETAAAPDRVTEAVGGVAERPVALVDAGGPGVEATVSLFATDSSTLVDRTAELLASVRE